MKVVVGVDDSGRYCSSLNLLKRLTISNLEIELVNAVPAVETYAAMYPAQAVIRYDEILHSLEEGGKGVLHQADEEACRRGLKCGQRVIVGSKTEGLCMAADSEHADLLSVSTGPKGALERFFSGCLAQSLAIAAHQSILIAREVPPSKDKLKAVFATDHSTYANACLDLFLGWHAEGIESVTVLTAYDLDSQAFAKAGRQVAVNEQQVGKFIEDEIISKTEAVANRFREQGIKATAMTVRDEANRAIDHAMSTGADLLIMGARGHGFWDRLMLGSTAQHQVIENPHSVLILRTNSTPN
jgi:nucleotide-binding universal stress UspA family protein